MWSSAIGYSPFAVAQAAAGLLAQVAPDLGHELAEARVADVLAAARAGQVDIDEPLQPAGPVGHHQHPVGQLHAFGDAVGDQQDGLVQLALDAQHGVAEQQPCLLVERPERLVHHQDFGRVGERSGDGGALPHAAGDLVRVAPLEAVQPDQPHEMGGAVEAFGLGDALAFERQSDVLEHGAPGEGAFLLEHHADAAVGGAGPDRGAVDADLSLPAVHQSADHAEQRALAAAGWADDGHELAAADVERDAVHRHHLAVGRPEPLSDAVHFQHRLVDRGGGGALRGGGLTHPWSRG